MRQNSLVAAAVLSAVIFVGSPRIAFAAACVVADPTGTPLNVRAEPNGPILSRLNNGSSVQLVEQMSVDGKRWAQVAAHGETLGWVFADYLDCRGYEDNLKSAPMHPRTAPE